MAGFYLHVPFCRSACDYCDFYFSLQASRISPMLDAMLTEIEDRKDYLESNQVIETIYFGGGTPTVLNIKQLELLVKAIKKNYKTAVKEFTIETNPDDLNENYLKDLLDLGINRLSIGIQSFDSRILKVLNRVHDEKKARQSIEIAYKAGFNNISIDLIYGIPGMNRNEWMESLKWIGVFKPAHVSAYHLTYEAGTKMWHKLQKKRLVEITEDESVEQFHLLKEILENMGYDQYEVSNFARNESFSMHNVNYWKRIPYIGIGPSAHSFNGFSRRWNIRGIQKYITKVKEKQQYFEEEILSMQDIYNEYILTAFRTKWGLHIDEINMTGDKFREYFLSNITQFIKSGDVIHLGNREFYLTGKGLLRADYICSELFFYIS